jgi:hypothetical protein
MGTLLPNYRKNIVSNIINTITANNGTYYAFGSNPVSYSGNTPAVTKDDFSSEFTPNWQMLFGKKLANTDVVPVIKNIVWTSNTMYEMYDNTQDISNTNYYVIVTPSLPGGAYNVYKCINNSNGAPSTVIPDQVQTTSFTKSDGYTWRYITTITAANYTKFATNDYVPIYSNSTIVSGAYNYSGVEVCVVANSGSGYNSYGNGTIRGVVNSTLIQIENYSSGDNDFYTNNGIYIYNVSEATSQLRVVKQYVSNSAGKWIYLNQAANTTNITPAVTQYLITPQVVFETDADSAPKAYSTINSSSNGISSIVIIDTGYGVSWSNVSIVSNTSYGSGANCYAICPPAGGHGFDPAVELNTKGLGISFTFANTEGNTIPVNLVYNKIGILTNPHSLTANGTKGSSFYTNTFSQVLQANVIPATTFAVGEVVSGMTSNAHGTVAYSNGSHIWLTGDKFFSNSEYILSANGLVSAQISINTKGSIYAKDIEPLYIQNIDNVTRSNSQSESYKIIIEI